MAALLAVQAMLTLKGLPTLRVEDSQLLHDCATRFVVLVAVTSTKR
jgi:hypothetical protein